MPLVTNVLQALLAISALPAASAAAWAQTPSSTALPAYCARIPPPSQTLPGATTFIYRTVGNRPLRIHVFPPEVAAARNPAAIFFFGGGFRVGDAASYTALAKAFAARGYVAAVADYRVLCRDGVTAVGGVDDAQAALGWVRAHAAEVRIDPRRIALVGGSAGGLLAASAGLRVPDRERPAALVLFNPVLNLETGIWAGDQSIAEAQAYSPSRLPIAKLPPTIVFHGTADKTVPIVTSRDFCARALAARRDCQLVEYQGMDHSFSDKQDVDPALGASPFDDTLKRAFRFLDPIMKPIRPARSSSAVEPLGY